MYVPRCPFVADKEKFVLNPMGWPHALAQRTNCKSLQKYYYSLSVVAVKLSIPGYLPPLQTQQVVYEQQTQWQNATEALQTAVSSGKILIQNTVSVQDTWCHYIIV